MSIERIILLMLTLLLLISTLICKRSCFKETVKERYVLLILLDISISTGDNKMSLFSTSQKIKYFNEVVYFNMHIYFSLANCFVSDCILLTKALKLILKTVYRYYHILINDSDSMKYTPLTLLRELSINNSRITFSLEILKWFNSHKKVKKELKKETSLILVMIQVEELSLKIIYKLVEPDSDSDFVSE